jgi:hypothetical protein
MYATSTYSMTHLLLQNLTTKLLLALSESGYFASEIPGQNHKIDYPERPNALRSMSKQNTAAINGEVFNSQIVLHRLITVVERSKA